MDGTLSSLLMYIEQRQKKHNKKKYFILLMYDITYLKNTIKLGGKVENSYKFDGRFLVTKCCFKQYFFCTHQVI